MEELEFLRKIKSASFATVEEGKPQVRIIDVMLVQDQKIQFTTARGKSFYRQLKDNPFVAIAAMDETYRTVRVSGSVKLVDRSYVDRIFDENPMMNDALYALKVHTRYMSRTSNMKNERVWNPW